MSAAKSTPDGFRTITPALVIKEAAEAIEFYKKAFGAEVVMNLTGPQNSIVHAEIKIGNSIIMISGEWPGHHVQSPGTVGGTTTTLHVYTDDVDASHKRAVEAGAKENMPPADMFWGDRYSSVSDPYGHSWSLATHVKDLSEEECQKACDEWMAQMAQQGGDS